MSLMVIPAKAGEGEWGFAVGLKAISGDIDTSGSEQERATANTNAYEVIKTTKSASVDFGSVFAEFSGRDGFFGFTTGVEAIPGSATLGSGSRTDTDLSGGSEGGTSKTYTASADVENLITFYVEPTLYLAEGFGLYAKAGVTTLDLKTLESISSGTDSAVYPDATMVGGVLGAGIRYQHSSGFLVKLEHTDTNFRPYTAEATTGNKNIIKAEIDYTATSLALGWQF